MGWALGCCGAPDCRPGQSCNHTKPTSLTRLFHSLRGSELPVQAARVAPGPPPGCCTTGCAGGCALKERTGLHPCAAETLCLSRRRSQILDPKGSGCALPAAFTGENQAEGPVVRLRCARDCTEPRLQVNEQKCTGGSASPRIASRPPCVSV